MAAAWKYDVKLKIWLYQLMHIYVKNIPAKFHPNPSLGLLKMVTPINKNKMSSDMRMRSVPDWKITISWLGGDIIAIFSCNRKRQLHCSWVASSSTMLVSSSGAGVSDSEVPTCCWVMPASLITFSPEQNKYPLNMVQSNGERQLQSQHKCWICLDE